MAKCIDHVLIHELQSLMLQKELDQITVAELVNASEINRKTFYNHFSGISALLCFIFHNSFTQNVSGRIKPYEWDTVLVNFLHVINENKIFIKKCLSSKYADDIRWQFRQDFEIELSLYVKDSLQLMKNTSDKEVSLSPKQEHLLVRYYLSTMSSLIEEWIYDDMQSPIEDYVCIIKELTSNGIFAGIRHLTLDN